MSDLKQRLLERRRIDPDTGCWLWDGSLDSKGYGQIKVGGRRGKLWRVHRLAAVVFLGFDGDSAVQVLHKCDTPACFNPDHLFLGTISDNVRDMYVKGRRSYQGYARGEKVGGSKLTPDLVLEIRRRLSLGETQRSIAKAFGIHQTTVRDIKSRHIWAHVPG